MAITTKTLKVRIKDKHARVLQEWSRAVNFSALPLLDEVAATSFITKNKDKRP